ncbi:hypothetical protein HBH52_237480 [Parastagonospora nodorum]|nr:hypothetical protein HBH52_237480 [Parastagonospora nodorum]
MEDLQQSTPTPDREASPLFEPELPKTIVQHVTAMETIEKEPEVIPIPGTPVQERMPTPPSPVLVAVVDQMPILPSPVITIEKVDTAEEELTPHFVQKLKDIEDVARAQMAGWDSKYQGQPIEKGSASAGAGMKRKASEMDTDSSDEGDDADSEDGGDEVQPFDPNSLDRPKLPIYHPGFSLTENIALHTLQVFTDFIKVTKSNGYNDDEVTYLWNEIMRSTKIPYRDAVKLAVAGETGAGKSALLNAILGVLNLTIESDGGGACTCVITEFRQSPSTQTAPFAAEVQFYCLEMCRKLVTDLFKQWFTVKQKQSQNPDDVDDEELSQMATARDCLNQLFADRLGFDSVENFMSTAASVNDRKVVKQLMTWTTEIHRMFIEDGETSVHFTSSTPEELTEMYHPFTRECQNASFRDRPLRFTPWPLVQIVRVTLSSPILKQNVIIADVPGGSDVNYFRIDNASRYLQQCDMTVVVGKIDRLQDNVGFRQQYMDAFRRRRSGSVILVATRSDDLNDEGGSTLVMDTTAEEQLALITSKITNVETKLKVIGNDMERYRINNNKKTKKVLRAQRKKLLSRKIALEKERKEVRIACRSKQVARVITQNYRADTGDEANVPVFCVSNRMFMRHLRGYDKDSSETVPTMSIDETQIPALCSHIYSLPSRGRTASLDHFIKVSMQTLLSVIQMSCSTTTMARVKHLTAVVSDSRGNISTKIDALATAFKTTDIKAIEDELADHTVQTRFDKHAIRCLNKWENLNAATHRAVMNKKGVYVQKKKNLFMNWNEELMSSVRPIIDQAFRSLLDKSVENFKAEAAQTIKEALRDLNHVLKNDPTALACDAYKTCFSDNLKRYELEFTRLVDVAAKDLNNRLIKIHLNAYKLRPDDYFPEAMKSFYSKAFKTPKTAPAKTMFESRCAYLKEAIPGPEGPYSFLSGWVEEDASKVMDEVSETLRTNVDNVLKQVHNAFEYMKKRKENDSPLGKKFRTELHQLVAEAKRIMEEVAQDSLELCKQYK